MKRLRVILLFLLLGAIVNVAVAWGCAILVKYDMSPPDAGLSSASDSCWLLSRKDTFGSTFLMGNAILDTNQRDSYLRVRSIYSPNAVMPHLPAWSIFADPPTMRMTMLEDSRGWPFRTLSKIVTITNSTPISQYVWIVREPPNEIYLPLAPIWRGVLLNTFFYASLFWLLIPGPFALRRFIRFRHGLCVKCAYDLRGAEHEACPECGISVVNKKMPA